MAVVTILDIPRLTHQEYEAVGASLGLSEAPVGILYHSCGPFEGGWRVVDVWESRAAHDSFIDAVFLPAVRALGGAEPSRHEIVEAHHAGPVAR